MTGIAPHPLPGEKHRIAVLPTTPLGRRAVWLAAAWLVLVPAWRILPGGAGLGFACGLAGGIIGLVAILRRGSGL